MDCLHKDILICSSCVVLIVQMYIMRLINLPVISTYAYIQYISLYYIALMVLPFIYLHVL